MPVWIGVRCRTGSTAGASCVNPSLYARKCWFHTLAMVGLMGVLVMQWKNRKQVLTDLLCCCCYVLQSVLLTSSPTTLFDLIQFVYPVSR